MTSNKQSVGMFGGGGVGKTAISLQFTKGEFTEGYIPTIEDEFVKTVEVDGKQIELEIIDTAGQDDFAEMRHSYMQRVNGFIFVFSIIDPNSINELDKIYTDAVHARSSSPVNCVIAANKSDMRNGESVPESKLKELETKYKCKVLETSAKTAKNINELFIEIVRILLTSNDKKPAPKNNDETGGCCLIQ
ncbi:Ras-like protein RAS2 [Tritrichomonas foetus]|uniref:Ras-like protein RAS2 n=1 Tax=Tritrichomonas foetus TaxID=1144522 RepID=A0A1J4JQU7_9EUKA|nr:Ras-like protein RAS2 [Tritrichomonas foetus]|eukprot:OHS99891.1 Ras-like protein RAS2 [Tritrichomonas foetus]